MSARLAADLDRVLGIAQAGPRPLAQLRQAADLVTDDSIDLSEEDIVRALRREDWGGPVRQVVKRYLTAWDYARDGWADGTDPNTLDRREQIYDCLEIGDELRGLLGERIPPYISDPIIVVAREFEHHWYTAERRTNQDLYWQAYIQQLRERGWLEESINDLDESTIAVVERLSDPTRPEIYQAKGLVVGYVQSGKTANITGVIARATDAGYRLVIVLSGMTNLLRAQTQRRIDKELIGKELIRPSSASTEDEDLDYLDDADWDEFIEHGAVPSQLGSFDWSRLTGATSDYQRLKAGIQTLDFERRDNSQPFHAPANLFDARAKIMVVKKNAGILKKVGKDLARVSARLADVPTIVIDDESDQASINTRKRTRREEERRTAVNNAIVELLKQLPRAQYVGYTATPFANVFIDPGDPEDLFPKDFLIALKRPPRYMGASDFHDLDGDPSEQGEDPLSSNRLAFIRDLRGPDERDENLLMAIDTYVLTGAVKLFREVAGHMKPFRHHTMLIHSSTRTADHEMMHELVDQTLERAQYEAGAGQRRLRRLFDEDLLPVHRRRAPDLKMPEDFDELRAYIGRTLDKLTNDQPVEIVNGTDAGSDPDFDRQPVWKILVGGAKLSRGYTIEGLTVSYFRRKASAADTLMQMGRWFGFREGYGDLVRVFIGREEGRGRRTVDLYEDFEGICRDEEEFRRQLSRYAMPRDGSPPITPIQVPPLVHSHLPWLPPVARNKRFNAEIREQSPAGQWREKTLAPTSPRDLTKNADLFRNLLDDVELRTSLLSTGEEKVRCIHGIADVRPVLEVLRSYRWLPGTHPLQLELEYLSGEGELRADIADWLVVAPQLQQRESPPTWSAGGSEFTIKQRSRLAGNRFKAYSERVHRPMCEAVTGKSRAPDPNDELLGLIGDRRGVLLFYPVAEEPTTCSEDSPPTMGFALLFPGEETSRTIFTVRDPNHPDRPVVEQ